MPSSYYVFFTERPAEGLQSVYGPYALRQAQDYARISSSHGGAAEVWRRGFRTPGSKRVRVYEHGKRAWPRTRAQAAELRGKEVPSRMRPGRRNPGGSNMARTKEELLAFIGVDDFMSQYVETLLWSTTDEEGYPLDDNYEIEDFTKEGLQRIMDDCETFRAKRGVEAAIESSEYEGADEQAGHDFWLTRNGHGAGFWDGDWPEPAATTLTKAAEAMGEIWVYVGDNGRLYLTQ